jgi:site-specific recombinase XerD
MKPTDFSKSLTDFLSKYLPGEKGVSSNTIASYKATFILLIQFVEAEKRIKIQHLALKHLTKECIVEYLNWLQSKRQCAVSSRNVRLAAIHSFFNYVQYEYPENLIESQRVLSIKVKRAKKISMNYLSVDGIKLLFAQPDLTTKKGRRDLTLLCLMYDCAARVQEIIDLTPSSVRLNKPYTIRIVGKGSKSRIVPLLDEQVEHLKQYMQENRLNEINANLHPLFFNGRKEKLTRAGVNYILARYLKIAKDQDPKSIPDNISCHSLRHSKAMHLLQAGVNLVYIRDILGHVSVTTTEVYARADSKAKREAIEKAYTNVIQTETPLWTENASLMSWLKSL